MTGGCCMPGGYQRPDHVALLAALRDHGYPVPSGATIGGPHDGWRWRVLTARGTEPEHGHRIRGTGSPASTVASSGADGWLTGYDGAGWHVRPVRTD